MDLKSLDSAEVSANFGLAGKEEAIDPSTLLLVLLLLLPLLDAFGCGAGGRGDRRDTDGLEASSGVDSFGVLPAPEPFLSLFRRNILFIVFRIDIPLNMYQYRPEERGGWFCWSTKLDLRQAQRCHCTSRQDVPYNVRFRHSEYY